MQLAFENTMTFDDGAKTCHSHEPDNTFTEFFLKDRRISNKSADPVNGIFSNLTFIDEARRMTKVSARDFGVKTFPHFGSYGFYTLLYKPTSIVVIPINRTAEKRTAPEVVITDTGTTIHLVITGDYECYRVEVRKDLFATEFITYDETFDFIPMYDGDCIITVTGHSNEISVTSEAFETDVTLVDRTVPVSSGIVASVNHIAPDEFGNVSIAIPEGAVLSVNGVEPDVTGNVALDAGEVPFAATGFVADTVEEAIVEADTTDANSITLTVAGWAGGLTQTVTRNGVTVNNTVIVAPAPASQAAYTSSGVLCTAQGNNTLTFTCSVIPTVNLTVGTVVL